MQSTTAHYRRLDHRMGSLRHRPTSLFCSKPASRSRSSSHAASSRMTPSCSSWRATRRRSRTTESKKPCWCVPNQLQLQQHNITVCMYRFPLSLPFRVFRKDVYSNTSLFRSPVTQQKSTGTENAFVYCRLRLTHWKFDRYSKNRDREALLYNQRHN